MKPSTSFFKNFIDFTRTRTRRCSRWLPPLAVATLVWSVVLPTGAAGLPNQLEMALHGQPNTFYLVEASPDLQHWTIIATNRSNPAGVLGFHDSQAGQFPRRYYRGVQMTGTLSGQGLLGENYDPGDRKSVV